MIGSGASGTLGYLDQLREAWELALGEGISFTFEIIMGILAALTLIGGLGVIIGGLILTTRYVEAGRIVILVSVGTGVLSLVMSLVQLLLAGTLAMGLAIQLAQSLGWLGAILSVQARIIAEQQPIMPKETRTITPILTSDIENRD